MDRDDAFVRKSWLALLLLFPLPLLCEYSGLDVWIENYYFNPVTHRFPWRDVFWFNVLLHDGLRTVLVFTGTMILLAMLLSVVAPQYIRPVLPAFWRRTRVLAYLLVALLSGPLVISLLKSVTARECPWHLAMYGGEHAYYGLWQAALFNPDSPGQCFPGSHASGGFALLAFVPLLAGRQRMLMLIFAMLLGIGMGWTRMMQGAHFLSHNLWSAWICWAVVLISYAFINPVKRARSYHDKKICEPC